MIHTSQGHTESVYVECLRKGLWMLVMIVVLPEALTSLSSLELCLPLRLAVMFSWEGGHLLLLFYR